ncbi:Putative Heat Shock transcription factor [Ectocarpus siliculosus]|uniref:Heat Shock transcription factor n=1 Tax=Ectocarpus siliculosus TaxID=2880 RepID=D8LDA5_ECTSI|nr:Putative Heat Shock transcription factor [Ectocarpus siliculosus]|eukprot:CBN80163.1 Putative Heat Shock transcription factor [Ectocarpus siliculosus]
MANASEGESGNEAFARKLAEILTTESTATISWNANGSAFQVHDVERFSEDILTKYYRHSKFSSFQRQLNLYSFRKIVKGADAGGYAHPMFRRDRPDDLYHVRRSISGSARYEPAAAAAKATAKRNAAASKAAALKQQASAAAAAARGEWSPPARVHKSGAAARRVGKLRNKSSPAGSNSSSRGGDKPSSYSARLVADHQRAGVATAAAAAAPGSGGGGVGIPASSADAAAGSSDAGERSPWTSGESSDSDAAATLPQAGVSAASARRKQQLQQQRKQQARRGDTAAAAATDSSGDEASSSEDSDEDCVGRSHEQQQHALERGGRLAEKRQQQGRRSYSPSLRDTSGEVAGECGRGGGEGTQQLRDGGEAPAGAGSASPTRKSSPFSFFKKFSFVERQSSSGHNRNMSTSSSVDMTTAGALPSERPASSSAGDDGPISPLMVDTSAEARAAASGASLRGVRPPPVTVTGGGQRIPIDPSTAAGNKALTSSPLTPKSSLEAAAMATAAAAAAASAMPPPPKREQREELGLVEQLTNMVEVFDICDLLRKVSTSGSSRLDKHGAIMKPSSGGGGGGGPHHLRNMSVDTDQGMPQSPLGGGQSPTGLGSLASMELVRDSSKDWDTLMAGSADVSDLGNTMVQSVAEFFSF